jgi:hypothetical protein
MNPINKNAIMISGLIGIIIAFLFIGFIFKFAFATIGFAFKLVCWILGLAFSLIGCVLGGGLLILLGFIVVGVPILIFLKIIK